MTREVAAFFRTLVVDPRSRRAIEETSLDACLEAAAAKSPVARAICHLRSVVALLRAVVGSLPREIARAPLGGLALRLTTFAIVPSVLLTAFFFPYWEANSLPRAALFLFFLQTAVVVFLPLAWLFALAVGRGRGSIPALAAAAMAFFVRAALAVLSAVLADRGYYAAIGAPVEGPLVSLTAPAAAVVMFFWLVKIATTASFAGAFALFATRVGSQVVRGWTRWAILVSVTVLYVIALRLTMTMPMLLTKLVPGWLAMLGMMVGVWCATGALVAGAVALSHRSRAGDLSSADPFESGAR